MENRFVHSYWSAPSLGGRWNVDEKIQTVTNMWYFATSVAYLKKLNQEIVLYTDNFGKNILDHIPYSRIYTSLENIPSKINTSLWEYGKMYAMKNESLSSIHLDGDVFIKSEECVDQIINSDGDILVQSLETLNENSSDYIVALNSIKHLKFPKNVSRNLENACNTGIFKFGSEEFKNKFLNTYFTMADTISGSIRCQDIYKSNKFISPDVIIEQKFLWDLGKDYKINVLLPQGSEKEYAINIKYQHVAGTNKYDQVSTCQRVLKQLDPDLYDLCKAKEEKILKWNQIF